MLIISLKVLLTILLSLLFFWCGNRLNCMDNKTSTVIRWAFILKRAGAASLILALWTFDPFSRVAALLLPIGISILVLADRRENGRGEWCLYHTIMRKLGLWKY